MLSRSDPHAAPRSVMADSAGRFEFTGVEPGIYLVSFDHPSLDSLGIRSPLRALRLASSSDRTVKLDLAIPSGRTVHDAFCPGRPANDSSSAIIGHLGDASTRGVVADGAIQATWFDVSHRSAKLAVIPGRAATRSGADGWFALCDVPPHTSIELRADKGSDSSAAVDVMTPATRGLVRRELYLPGDDARREGVIRGRVVNADGGTPVARAQLRDATTGMTTTSATDGSFTFAGLPYGTATLGVRSIGHVPKDVTVDVLAGAPATVKVELLTSSNVLDTVRVRAARTLAEESGFSERRKAGFGTFFDSRQIDRIQPMETSDLVKRSPGVEIASSGPKTRILMRDITSGHYTCQPVYFLDGRWLKNIETVQDLEFFVPPERLAAIEVYHDAADIPGQFIPPGGVPCGAIVMWSLPPELWRGHQRAAADSSAPIS